MFGMMDFPLSRQAENMLAAFRGQLAGIGGPEDMFPPDIHVRQPIPEPRPSLSGSEALSIASINENAIRGLQREQRLAGVALSCLKYGQSDRYL